MATKNLYLFVVAALYALFHLSQQNDCLLPQPPKNGYIISELFGKIAHSEYDPKIMKFIPEDEYVSFSCDNKYKIEGEETIYCDEGSLEHEVPVCVKKYCDSPPAVENGYYAKRRSKKRVFKKLMYKEGTKLFVNCTEGYRHKIGSPKIVQCLRVKNDLLWTSDNHICEKCSQCGVAVAEEVKNPGRAFGNETKTYWPWMAMLRQYNKIENTFSGFCGGSIIDQDWILTAAHCMYYYGAEPIKWNMRKPENVYVRLGYTKSLNDTNIQDIKSSKIYIHPEYYKLEKFDYDVALIKLAHSIEYEERVRPVCLCPHAKDIPDESNLYAEKTKGWAIGFGIFSHDPKDKRETFKTLREVVLEIRSDEECSNGFLGSKYKTYTTRMFCAGGEKDKDTCSGDSGGPFMKKQHNADGTVSWVQTGITSFNPRNTCGERGEYGYYTNVATVRDWIDKTIQVHGNNNCLLPEPPENGYLISDHWGTITHSEYDPEIIKYVMENTSVSFSCDDKYKIVGKDKIFCHDGELEHEVPLCVTISCETPPNIENAVYEKLSDSGSTFVYGDEIRFDCLKDFVLVGAKTLYCTANGWSDKFPSCQAFYCDNVDLSEGVEIESSTNPLNSQNKYPYQTKISYKCVSLNYELNGSSSQTCTENGWNGETPSCKLTGCLDPDIPENGRIYQRYKNNPESKYYSFGDFALFSCNEGYKIEQESNQTENQASKSLCTSKGTWTKIPRCNEIYCLRPEHPENGKYLNLLPEEGSHYPMDYILPFECDPGYTLENPNKKSRKCLSNGKWTSYQPKCIEVTCDSPPKIPNANLQTTALGRMTAGFKVAYDCNDGHHMVPKGEDPPGLKCTETGQWSEPNFECQTITCEKPPNIENAVYEKLSDSGSTFEYGDEIRFDCLNNLVLVGAKTLNCTANGWSDDFPSCQAFFCDNVDLSEGVEIERSTNPLNSQNKYPYKTVVFYKCVSLNYELIGSSSQTCTENGWNGREPFCKLTGCLDPDIPENGRIYQRHKNNSLSRYYSFGDFALFSCNWGYKMEHDSNQTEKQASKSLCTSDGTWTKIPRCIEMYCLRPEHAENGRYQNLLPEEGSHYPVDYVITIECDPGYTLENPNNKSRKCLSNGKWTGSHPKCIGLQCEPPPRINDGTLRYYQRDYYPVGSRAGVQCNRGFIKRKEEVTCLENGKWDVEDTLCQGRFKARGCGPVPRIENGVLVIYPSDELYFIGAMAVVRCDRGYDQKNFYVVCLENGNWNITGRECQIKDHSVCGKGFDSSTVVNDSSSRNISDADHSTLQRWPWTVQLFTRESGKSYVPTCLGSLIDKEWVLTSGLCFAKNTDPRRILTKTGIDKYHLSVAKRIVQIENRAEDKNMWTANAALIKLKKPVTFSQFVHSVCLPEALEGFSKSQGPEKTVYSSSWSKGIQNGKHDNIERMHMAIQTKEDCSNSLSKDLASEKKLDTNIFCAVDNAGVLDVCGPDLGSPLYQYVVTSGNQARWVQMGIASAFENHVNGEIKCLNPSRFYDLFLDVSRIVSSIRNIVKNYSVCGIDFDSSMVVNGLSNQNISDADHSSLQRWPWTVQLFTIKSGKRYVPTCLGSLIDKEWVLTSGLCFAKNINPRRILTKTGIDKYHLSVADRIVHIENGAQNDKMWTANAALIKLKKPVTFSQFVHPVCLPDVQEGFSKSQGPEKTVYSSSWSKGIQNGRHGDIEQMRMAIQTKENCSNSLSKDMVSVEKLGPNIFCAVDKAGVLDVCGPDLGSPLYHYVVTSGNQAQWVQMGIASAFENQVDGEMKCLNPSRFYDLFLDVSRIVSSIRNIIKSS